ncbi:hypothetical protein F4861DRAFT_188210 [Xylaria intraflava]|nr:hypothetical protein F4861DRAFT_188210 [Xylaria intraflava]
MGYTQMLSRLGCSRIGNEGKAHACRPLRVSRVGLVGSDEPIPNLSIHLCGINIFAIFGGDEVSGGFTGELSGYKCLAAGSSRLLRIEREDTRTTRYNMMAGHYYHETFMSLDKPGFLEGRDLLGYYPAVKVGICDELVTKTRYSFVSASIGSLIYLITFYIIYHVGEA